MSGIGEFPTPPPPPALVDPARLSPVAPAAPLMVPAPALAAPFATPVAPFGRGKSAPVSATPQVTAVPEWPQKKSRAPLILVAVLLLALGAVAYFFGLKAAEDAPRPAPPISALPAVAPDAPHVGSAEVSAPPRTDSAAQPGSAPRSNLLDPPGTPITTPNAGFAEMFASGARRADEKKGPSDATLRFDPNAAKAALATAAFEAAKCRENGGPTGQATVVVTFEPSGKVTSATVSDPPFAGTSSGACIAGAMKRATVPTFSGLPGTVTKIISIQ